MSDMEQVRQRLQGFVFPDSRINHARPWLAHSSFTQAGPYLDIPKPEVHTNMVLQASGDISNPVSMILRAQRGGMPKAGGAGFVFRDSSDEGNRYRGWDTYAHRTHSEVLRPSSAGGFYPHFDNFGGIETIDKSLVLCGETTTWFNGSGAKPTVYTVSRIDGAWQSPVSVFTETTTNQTHPALLELPNGKLLLFHWVFDGDAQTANIRMWWSEDSGVSWSLAQYTILPEAIDLTKYKPKRIAPAFLNGQVAIVAHLLSIQETRIQAYRDLLVQWASNDLGASCTEVAWWESTATTRDGSTVGDAGRGLPVVLTREGQLEVFFLAYGKPLDQTGSTDEPLMGIQPFFVSIGSAYDPISSAGSSMVRAQGSNAWGTLATMYEGETESNYIASGELTGVVDELGVIYIYGVQNDGMHRACVARSDDGGTSWAAMGDVASGYKEVGIEVSTDISYARSTKEVIGVGVGTDVTSFNVYINSTDPPFNGLEYPDHVPVNPDPSRTTLTWTSYGTTYSLTCTDYDATSKLVYGGDSHVFYNLKVEDGTITIDFRIHYNNSNQYDGYFPDEGSNILLSYDYVVNTVYRLVIDGIYLEVSVPYTYDEMDAANEIRKAINAHPTLSKILYARQLGPSQYLTIISRVRGYDYSVVVGDLLSITSTTLGVSRKGSWHFAGGYSYPSQMFALKSGSQVAIVHGYISLAQIGLGDPEGEILGYGESMVVSWLGGFTSNTMPGRTDVRDEAGQIQWDYMWSAYNAPQYEGWWVGGIGSETVNNDGTMSAESSRYYYRNWTGSSDTMKFGTLLHVVLEPTEDNMAKAVALRLIISSGTRSQAFLVYVGTTRIQVLDSASGTSQDIPFSSESGFVELLVAASDGQAYVWARIYDGTDDRLFETIVAGFTLTDVVSAATENEASWGNGPSTSASVWKRAEYLILRSGWQAPSQGFSNPVDLFTKQISTDRSSPTSFPQGVQLVAVSGPAYVGDYWLVQSLYRYPVSNLGSLLKPSPRDCWRSTGTTQNQIAYLISSSSTSATRLQSNAIGVYAAGCNFRLFTLEGMLANGTWETIRDFDLADDRVDLPYTRLGNAIVPASSAGYGVRNVFDRSLAGGTIDLGGGALRLVSDNSAGAWTGSSTATMQTPTIILADGDDSEPTSGTCSIWSPDLGAIIFTNTPYVALRFTIPTQDTRDGYFQAGCLWAGPVAFLGQPYGYTWSLEDSGANVEIVDLPDNRDIVRELGPARRTWALAWADAVNQTEVLAASPQARYLTHKEGGAPLGLVCDTPRQLQGILRRLRGPKTPVLFFAAMEPSESDADLAVCVDRDLMMLCRVMGPITKENVWGDENDVELQRVSSFHLREIP